MTAITKVLKAATFETFEKMFFVFLEQSDQEIRDADLESCISFRGSLNGSLHLLITRNMAVAMLKNMLNCDDADIADKNLEDCLKEATNVVCGNFLTKYENKASFHLSIPEVRKGNIRLSDVASDRDNIINIHFMSDCGNLCVRMMMSAN
jgi:CheY-specific phosphatase CheX